ncbi:thiamine phosphate synthase [bacterium]|nr:thiamine phosphate synthase [bacterium]
MIDHFGLYVILTNPVIGYEAAAEAAVAEGVKYLQLRIKDSSADDILEIARNIRSITHDSPTKFIMNDDLDIAMAVDADGIHLGQDDLPIKEARLKWPASNKIFGLSTHNASQALEAASKNPDYIGIGPVFATPTKVIPDPVVGLKEMERIIKSAQLTTVAIGGIDQANLPAVLSHGAINFCAVRAIMQSTMPGQIIRQMMELWKGKGKRA